VTENYTLMFSTLLMSSLPAVQPERTRYAFFLLRTERAMDDTLDKSDRQIILAMRQRSELLYLKEYSELPKLD
jgi:hypothetical protein